MPLYEYQCDACGHRFEMIQKFSDPPSRTCPKCGGPVRKLLSSPAFQFKGTGLYITDYAKKDQTAAEKADSAAGEKAAKTRAGEVREGGQSREKAEKSDEVREDRATKSTRPIVGEDRQEHVDRRRFVVGSSDSVYDRARRARRAAKAGT